MVILRIDAVSAGFDSRIAQTGATAGDCLQGRSGPRDAGEAGRSVAPARGRSLSPSSDAQPGVDDCCPPLRPHNGVANPQRRAAAKGAKCIGPLLGAKAAEGISRNERGVLALLAKRIPNNTKGADP
jgi:hypothetical protein